jgi:hypothetical protein
MTDILKTMLAELDEAIELMRPHFPDDSEDALFARAASKRRERYAKGRWPDFAEVAKEEAEMAKKEAAEAKQEPEAA